MKLISHLIILVFLFNFCESWRRRRRVSYAGDSEQRRKRVLTKKRRQESCLLHGEYAKKNGKIVPANAFDTFVQNIKCNNERCWKGDYCWECRLRNGKKAYEPLTKQKLGNLVCEDAQCLLGKLDVAFHYYSTNESRSLPLPSGPFHCNKYICMTSKQCWKCRLNSDDSDFKTVQKGKEFNEKVTCCPIPKVLASISNAISTVTSRMQQKKDSNDVMSLSEDDSINELDEDEQILIDLNKKKLVTGIHIQGRNNSKKNRFTVTHSVDGRKWVDYKEYNLKAIFYSKRTPGSRTLFKPIITRYLKIIPINNRKGKRIKVDVVGCDLLSTKEHERDAR